MAKKILGKDEDLFDYLRKQAADDLSHDAFDGVGNVFVRVLKVFEITISKKGYNWIDAVTPTPRHGSKTKIMAFKGRVFTNNYEKYLTIHSAIPEPDEYQKHPHVNRFIEMHPTFLIMKNTGDQKLEKGDVCRCTFPSTYPDAGGDSYGFFVDKISNVASTGLVMRQEMMAKEAFDPKKRVFDPPLPKKSFFEKLPMNIVMIGDNMFGTSPTKLGVDSKMATTLKSRLRGIYKALDKLARGKTTPAKIAKSYDLDPIVLGRVAEKLNEKKGTRVPYKNLEVHNLAVGNIDATYYDPSPESKKLYAGAAGSVKWTKLEATVQSGAEIIDLVKHLKEPNAIGEAAPPTFFIAGFEGNSSAIPGWAGLLPDSGAGAVDALAHSAWGGEAPLTATKKEYTQLQKYAEFIAGENPGKFTTIKQKQFKAVLDHLKNGGMEGGVLVGPLVYTAQGKSYIGAVYLSQGTTSMEIYPGAYSLETKPFTSGKAKNIQEPTFHGPFHYRSGTSEAMRKAAEAHSLKVFTSLPYCFRNTDDPDDFSEYSEVVPIPMRSGANSNVVRSRERILTSWIINNILLYACDEEAGSQAPKCKKASTQYGEDVPINTDRSEGLNYDKDDVSKSARMQRQLRVQKEMLGELDKIYQKILDKGDPTAAETAEMMQYTNETVKKINAYLKSGVLGFASGLPD